MLIQYFSIIAVVQTPPQSPERPASEHAPAQPSATSESAPRPPELIEFHEATYPEQALTSGIEGEVVLSLNIDAQGRVSSAEVRNALHPELDEAARKAALLFRFSPAQHKGNAIPSRILYAYKFELPVPEPPPQLELQPRTSKPSPGLDETAPGSALRGRVRMPGDSGELAVGAEIILVDDGGTSRSTRSNEQGEFEFTNLAARRYTITAQAAGLGRIQLQIAVDGQHDSELALQLLPETQGEALEVTVEGRSDAALRMESAEAVQVVETGEARKQTADLGEVLARQSGVGVRRMGGLGSVTRISLAGLSNDQIRFFNEGVPLALSGYPFGLANVPVNAIERVDVYRGVVPIRFGADALGGAVDIVAPKPEPGVHAGASYQAGSFATQRANASVQFLGDRSGFYASAAGFIDAADNDYTIDVEVPNAKGKFQDAKVRRFHDGYWARGINLKLGVLGKPWAKALIVRGFGTSYSKDLQHNIVMTLPYGEVKYGAKTAGTSLRYEQDFARFFSTDVLVGYSYSHLWFTDMAECVYDWFGMCIRARQSPGELSATPSDSIVDQHSGYGRFNLEFRPRDNHGITLNFAPTYETRTGKNHALKNSDALDPLTAVQDLTTIVGGLEYQLTLFEGRLDNVVFVKGYLQSARAEAPLPGDKVRNMDRDSRRGGFGDSLRFKILPWLYAKASYEWATRLPRADEVFGNGAMIVANLELQPEVSHNANLSISINELETKLGGWRADVNGFLRDADNLIALLGRDVFFAYQNVFSARSTGVQAGLGWTSPGQYFELDGNVTYQSFRNTSGEGTFGDYTGDRIPNLPYLFANGAARFQFSLLGDGRDQLALFWNTRYVHEFFRSWESVGLVEFKQTVDTQVVHGLGLSYSISGKLFNASFAGEIQNLTDARAFDTFGIQRPGRGFFFKTTFDL